MFQLPPRAALAIATPRPRGNPMFWPIARKLTGLSAFTRRLQRFGFQPVSIESVAIDRLFAFRAVRCEVVPETSRELIGFLEDWFKDENGDPDWRIRNSMHTRLFDTYLNGKMPNHLEQLDYWRWHESLAAVGVNARPPEWITTKIRNVLGLFDSIRQRGFDASRLENLPWVLDRPLIASRYGFDYTIPGYEIYDGHHRVAALCSLGQTSAPVLVVRDVGHETPFGIPFEQVMGRDGTRTPA